jgi:hypothetical protein
MLISPENRDFKFEAIDWEFKAKMYKEEACKLREELDEYKKAIMILRQGYDEEDCTTTCPHVQLLEKENQELLTTIARLVSEQTKQS